MIPAVSIVLITCNRADMALPCIASLLVQQVRDDLSYELVIVDDGSKDGTAGQLQLIVDSSSVPVRVVTTQGLGVPGARNLGAKHAQAAWVACFDDDQTASPGWLQALVDAQAQAQVRCVGGALRLHFLSGVRPQLGDRARRILGEHVRDASGLYASGDLPASNNVLIARDLLCGVDGFDESFHQGGSDTEFFGRLARSGERIWHAPDAVAFHLIPDGRLHQSYFRWVGRKVGAAQARILFKQRRHRQTSVALMKRGVATVGRDLPRLAMAVLRRDQAETLDARCSLWFSEGLLRGSMALAMPRRGRANRFLDSLNFRRHHGERADSV